MCVHIKMHIEINNISIFSLGYLIIGYLHFLLEVFLYFHTFCNKHGLVYN